MSDDTCAAHSSSGTSASLLARLRVHDEDAWVRLTRIYGPLVYRWCRKAGVRSDDAPDVLQEVFRAVAGGIGKFQRRDASDSFRGWLYGITRFKIQDHFRRVGGCPLALGGTAMQQRLAGLASEDESSSVASLTTPGDHSLVVRQALQLIRGEFEDRNWQAFWRTTIDQQGSGLVAVELGMTPGAVRQAKYRVLRRLRRELGDLGEV